MSVWIDGWELAVKMDRWTDRWMTEDRRGSTPFCFSKWLGPVQTHLYPLLFQGSSGATSLSLLSRQCPSQLVLHGAPGHHRFLFCSLYSQTWTPLGTVFSATPHPNSHYVLKGHRGGSSTLHMVSTIPL